MPDQFDALMNATCTIQLRKTAKDSYNQPSTGFDDVAANVACRFSTLGAGRESKADTQVAVNRLKVFMRPQVFEVTEHHFLFVDPKRYNVISVNNPGGMNHHLELVVEQVKP